MLGSRPHDPSGLFDRKEPFVAEDVDELGQSLAGYGRNHLAADQIDILRLTADVVAGHGVRPEEGGAHSDGRGLADTADHAQHLQFVCGREAVAALDLDAPRTHADDFADALHGLLVQLVLRGGAEPVGGVENAAAPAGDLLVAQAVDLVQKLLFAAAGIDQMGVRIAERREERPSLGIHRFVGLDRSELRHRSEGRDAPLFGQQPCVGQFGQLGHPGTADALDACGTDADDPGDILYQQPHNERRNRIEDSIWGYITSSFSMKGTCLR